MLDLMHSYNINGFSFPDVYCGRYLQVDSMTEKKGEPNPFFFF